MSRLGDKPKIFNTDQGVQGRSAAFTDVLKAAGIAISSPAAFECPDDEINMAA